MTSKRVPASFFKIPLLACLLGFCVAAWGQNGMNQVPFTALAAGIPAASYSGTTPASSVCSNALNTLGDGCPATQATLYSPYGVKGDSYNNLYVADTSDARVRVLYQGNATLSAVLTVGNPAWSFTPTAGYMYGFGGLSASITVQGTSYYCNNTTTNTVGVALDSFGDGCAAQYAYVSNPRNVAVDKAGNIFFVSSTGRVSVIYAGGTTVANMITASNSKASPQIGYIFLIATLPGTSPSGRDIAVDASDNLYVSDSANSRIEEFTAATATWSTVLASTGCSSGTAANGDGGPASSACLYPYSTTLPLSLYLDKYNNLYIGESRVRVIYGGGTTPPLYIEGGGSTASLVTTAPVVGNIYTVAGGYSSGHTPGSLAAEVAVNNYVTGIGMDQNGNLYYTDDYHYLWRVGAHDGIDYNLGGYSGNSTYGTISTSPTAGVACNGATGGPTMTDAYGDGCPATFVKGVGGLSSIVVDSAGNLYQVEQRSTSGHVAIVRKYVFTNQFNSVSVGSASNTIQLAFTPNTNTTYSTLPTPGFAVMGNSSTEFFDAGNDLCTTASSWTTCVYNVSFKPSAAGMRFGSLTLTPSTGGAAIATAAYLSGVGLGGQLAIDPAAHAMLGAGLTVSGVATDQSGNAYIVDAATGSLLRTTGGGSPVQMATGFIQPAQIAVDGIGNVYIADAGNNRIAVVTQAGSISSLFANYNTGYTLSSPKGVAVDAQGNIYIADTGNNRVLLATPLGGVILEGFSGLNAPQGIAVDGAGNLYVADSGNARIATLSAAGAQSGVSVSPALVSPVAIALDAAGDLYVADAGNENVIVIPSGTATAETLASNVSGLTAVAADGFGSVYYSSSLLSGVVVLDRTNTSYAFADTATGKTAMEVLTLNNTGNAAATLGATPVTGSDSANFSIASSNTNGCTSSQSLSAGQSCNLLATFQPQSVGAFTDAVSISSNASNAVTATLTGNGISSLFSTATNLVASSVSVVPGESVVLTATVSGTGAGAPTGTVTFSSTSTGASQGTLGTATLNNGVATYTGLVWVGTDTVTASYNGDANYSSSTSNAVTISNYSATGKIAFNWPYVSFGQSVAYGASSSAWPVTLQNLTGATIAAPSLTLSGAGASNFQITGNSCSSQLAQGASCGFNIVFVPTSGGSANGSATAATLTASTSTSASYSSTLAVSGIAVSSTLAFNWPFLNFTPTVAVGTTSTAWPVILTNRSGTSTTLASPAVSFTDASFALTSDGCSGQTLAAGGSCSFSVVFSPAAGEVTSGGTNVLSGTMTATGNSGAITGSLSVSGWAGAALSFNWPFVNFQPQIQGSTGTNLWPVTVTNSSGQALTGVTYTLTGGTNYQSGAFTLTNTCSTIAAGASCTFNIASSPVAAQTAGAYSATLVVAGTAGSTSYSSYALTVSGSVIAGSISINWNQDQQNGVSTIDFGPNNAVGITSGPWPITVYNNTPSAQTMTLTPSLAVFTTDSSTCTNVAAGGSCVFNLYFTPAALQSYQGTLTIAGSSGAYSCTFNTWGSAAH